MNIKVYIHGQLIDVYNHVTNYSRGNSGSILSVSFINDDNKPVHISGVELTVITEG